MSDKEKVVETPITSKRRLGLRRTRCNASLKIATDTKVNYKSLEHNNLLAKEIVDNTSKNCSTPSGSNLINKQNVVSTSNLNSSCRPYRLTLSKRLREKLTKRRLEFHIANECTKNKSDEEQQTITSEIELQPSSSSNSIVEDDQKTRHELIDEIRNLEKKIESQKNHEKRKTELLDLINVWREGFNNALTDLQKMAPPGTEVSEILKQLGIPQKMLKYIND